MRFSPPVIALSAVFLVVSSASIGKRADQDIDPQSAALVAEGMVAKKAGQFDVAQGWFETALAVDPRNRAAFVGLAEVSAERGLKGKAIGFYKSALIIEPNDLSVLAPDVYAFTDKSKSGTRLNIAAHGFVDSAAPSKKIVDIKAGEEEWNAGHLYKKVAEKYKLNKVGEIRLLVCGSANENKSSFAQQFSNLTGKPVTGHKNIVSFTPPFKSVEDLWIKSQSIHNGEKHFRNHPKLQRYLIKNQTPRTFKPNIR